MYFPAFAALLADRGLSHDLVSGWSLLTLMDRPAVRLRVSPEKINAR
jgi:hypothetical protein